MKVKHLTYRITCAKAAANLSPCGRRQVGAIIIDPNRNVVLSEGYNGAIRGGKPLCGGDSCQRDTQHIPSGEQLHIGCVHAEQNAIYNAANIGVSLQDSWAIITTHPCSACTKALIQVGVAAVIWLEGDYQDAESIRLLQDAGIYHAELSEDDFHQSLLRVYNHLHPHQ